MSRRSLAHDLLGIGAVIACATATVATSPPRASYPRNFPAWSLVRPAILEVSETRLELWVSKSGKEGIGLTLRVQNCSANPRRLEILDATLEVKDLRLAAELPRPRAIAGHALEHLYLPLVFDNQRLWNRGARAGVLELRLRLDGRVHALGGRAEHRLDGYHRTLHRYPPRPRPTESCRIAPCAPPPAPPASQQAPPASQQAPR